jgi:protein-S-isoprenylcysteine O-methyltransferase Ste14
MKTKVVIILIFSVLYGLFEFIMNTRQRKKGNVIKSEDKGSLILLTSMIALGYFLSFSFASTPAGRIYHWNTFFTTGAILAVTGLTIRITSITTLKKYFTYSVSKVEGHEIIEKGLYNKIRHPGYLGQLIIFAGISASLSNWLSILSMMIPVLIGFLYRIKVEERFMTDQLGSKYTDYQKRTKKLLPLIY